MARKADGRPRLYRHIIAMTGQIVDASLIAAPKQQSAHEDGGKPPVDIAIPSSDRRSSAVRTMCRSTEAFCPIRKWLATDAAAYEGARLREKLIDTTDVASAR